MEILEGEGLRKRILESYSKDPKGWSFVVSPSVKYGFYDGIVSGPDTTWMLKIDSLFKPFPTVLGSPSTADDNSKLGSAPSYGYRKLPSELILQVLLGEGPMLRKKTLGGLMSMLKSQPVVPEPDKSYAEGPFVLTSPAKLSLSESQREIDSKLASELYRLMKTRYPAYG